MRFISCRQAAEKWLVNERRVRYLAQSGRIDGAHLYKGKWLIPENISKPNIYKDIESKFDYLTKGRLFGANNNKFGGMYLPSTFQEFYKKIESDYKKIIKTKSFLKEIDYILNCLETPLFFAKKFKEKYEINLYIKREDLNRFHNVYCYQLIGLILLAKRMKKKTFLTVSGDIAYVRTAIEIANLINFKIKVFVPKYDYLKNKEAFKKLPDFLDSILIIGENKGDILDATYYAFRYYLLNEKECLFASQDAIGPYPIPNIIYSFLSKVSYEVFAQLKDIKLSAIISPSVSSNYLSLFSKFNGTKTPLFVVNSKHNYDISFEKPIKNMGFKTLGMVNEEEKPLQIPYEMPSMSFPMLSPILSNLKGLRKAKIVEIDDKLLDRYAKDFFNLEGIELSKEDSYSISYIIENKEKYKNKNLLICFTKRKE